MIEKKREIWQKEKSLTGYIPFSSVVAPGVVYCRNGELISTFRCCGIPFETCNDDDIDSAASRLNTFYGSLSRSDIAVQIHRIRRPVFDSLSAPKESGFAHDFAEKYNEKIGRQSLVATELYVTVIFRRLRSKDSTSSRTLEQIQEEFEARLEEFSHLTAGFESALSEYRPKRLGEFRDRGVLCSEQLSFYNFLLSGFWHTVRVPDGPIYEALSGVQLFAGHDTLELQSASGVVFAKSIELRDYADTTHAVILDGLLYPRLSGTEPYSFIETHTFCFLNKNQGLDALRKQRKQLIATEDESSTQIAAIGQAIDAAINGLFSLGEYSYSLLVFGTKENVGDHARHAAKLLEDEHFTPVFGTLALSAAYLHQLPGTPKWRPRIVTMTSLNFAHLAPLHNFPEGKRNCNPWGEALALLRTPSNQPYYFNFHFTPENKDSYGERALGHTIIIGSTGSGKTVLMNTLLTLSQKYGDSEKYSCVYFDLDKGAQAAIRVQNNSGYVSIESGKASGLNPFQMEATEENILFLIRWCRKLISRDGLPVTPLEENRLSSAVRAVMAMPKAVRRLALLPQNMIQGSSAEEINNSLTQRLRRWINDGEYAWVFDNPEDTLDFNRHAVFGIDGTDFLADEVISPCVTDYLLYRLDSVLDGRRVLIFMDEFWRYLRDPDTARYTLKKLKTIRKLNGVMVFATQNPEDLLNHADGANYVQNCVTKIFLPNTGASEDKYIDGFKVTPNEFSIIKEMGQHSRMMLIKQDKSSVTCKLDLGAFPLALKVFSGTPENNAFLENLIDLYGESPSAWLPYYLGERPIH